MSKYTLENLPATVLRRDGQRVLVAQAGYPFPRWVDASMLKRRPPPPFIPAPF